VPIKLIIVLFSLVDCCPHLHKVVGHMGDNTSAIRTSSRPHSPPATLNQKNSSRWQQSELRGEHYARKAFKTSKPQEFSSYRRSASSESLEWIRNYYYQWIPM